MFKKIYIATIAFHCFCLFQGHATTRYAIASAAWNAAGTWSNSSGGASCGCTPANGDDVVIEGGFTVTLTADATINSVSITQNSNLTHNNGITLTVTATATITGNPGAPNGTTAWNINAGIASVGGTVTVTGGSNNNRIGKIVLTSGSLDINADLTLSTGNAARAVIDMSGGASTLNLAGNFNVNTTGTLTPGASSTFTYDGSGAQTVGGGSAVTYYNLTVDKSANTATGGGQIDVGGTLTVTSGTLDVGANTIAVTGSTAVTGTLLISSATGSKSFTDLTINVGGTFNNTATETIDINGSITQNGTFTDGGGNYRLLGTGKSIGGGTISFGTVTVTGTYTNNTSTSMTITSSFAGGGTLTQGANSTLYIQPNNVNPTLDASTNTPNTVEYNGSGAQNLKVTNYSNLRINNSSGSNDFSAEGTYTVAGNLSMMEANGAYMQSLRLTDVIVNGNVSLAAGTEIRIPGSIGAGDDFTLNGNFDINGTFFINGAGGSITVNNVTVNSGGTWNNSSTEDITINGNIQNDGTFTSNTGVYTFAGAAKTISGTSGLTLDNAAVTGTYQNNITVAGGLSVTTALSGAGTLTQGVSANLFLGGTATITGLTATANLNTVEYTGTGAQTIKAAPYYHLIISGAGTSTQDGDLTVDGNLSLTGGTLDGSTFQITGNASGTFSMSSGTFLYIGSTASATAPTFPTAFTSGNISLNSASTVDYRTNGAQDISTTPTYGVLVLTTGASAAVKTLSGATLTIANDLTINSTVTLSATTSTIHLTDDISGAGTLGFSSGTLNIGGDSNGHSGTFTYGTSTVNANGSANQTLANYDYYNLTITSTGGTVDLWIATAFTVHGNLTVTSGTVTYGDITVTGTAGIAAGATVNIAGRTTVNNGPTTIDGTVNITGTTGSKTFNNDITISGTGTWNCSVNEIIALNNCDLTNNGTFTSGNGDYDLSGTGSFNGSSITFTDIDFEIAGGSYTNNATTLNVNSNIRATGGGTLIMAANTTLNTGEAGWPAGAALNASASGNTVNYNLSGAQDIIIPVSSYYHLSLSTSGTKTLQGVIDIDGDLAISGTAVFSVASNNITLAGNWSNSSTDPDPFTQGTGTVTFDGTSAQSINNTGDADGTYFNSITVNNSAAGNALTLNALTTVNGVITFTDGIVSSTATNLLVIDDDATAATASDNSHVSGYVKKIGNNAFTFPIGNGTYYRLLSISVPSTNADAFTAAYFLLDPNASYDVTQKDAALDHISRAEYWSLSRDAGATDVSVTLSWAAVSGGVDNLANLKVAGWDGSTWKDRGNGGTTGDVNSGTVVSSAGVPAFIAFALGSGTADNVLPIELLFFAAQLNGDKVDITWSTGSEKNNDYFTIERSADGINFTAIEQKKGAGNSIEKTDYTALDTEPLLGVSYYRLKQTDYDGKFTYSQLAAVSISFSSAFRISPNPVSPRETPTINLAGLDKDKEILVVVYDLNGKEMYSKITISGSNGDAVFGVDPYNNLKKGTYIIVAASDQKIYRQKLVIQ